MHLSEKPKEIVQEQITLEVWIAENCGKEHEFCGCAIYDKFVNWQTVKEKYQILET
jgi:hypothetical protein